MKIRKACLEDIGTITAIIAEFSEFEKKFDADFKTLDRKPLMKFQQYVKDGIKQKEGNFLLVAEKCNNIAGFIYCTTQKRPDVYTVKKVGYIKDLFVLAEHRAKGIGKALMEEATKEFKRRKLNYICLSVLSNNKNALQAYEERGFREFKKEMRKQI